MSSFVGFHHHLNEDHALHWVMLREFDAIKRSRSKDLFSLAATTEIVWDVCRLHPGVYDHVLYCVIRRRSKEEPPAARRPTHQVVVALRRAVEQVEVQVVETGRPGLAGGG
jgi:hypothetical protein